MKRTIVIILLEAFADWEAAFLAAALRGGTAPGAEGLFDVKYMTPHRRPVTSIGGLSVTADLDASALPDDCAGLVLTGGMGWRTPEAELTVPIVEEAVRRGLPVGGICNATLFLAAHGFLDSVRHTGNTVEMMRQWGGGKYRGEKLYIERQAVADGGFVTANGTAALEFTREYMRTLGAYRTEDIDGWYAFNKRGFYAE